MLSRAAGASRSAIANDHGSTLPPDLEPDVGCNYHIAPVARRIPRPTGARVGSALAAPAAFSHSTASRLPPSREPPRAVPGRRKAVSGCAMLTREDHHALQVWCAQSNIAAHRMQLSAPQLEHMRERHRRLGRGRLRRARGASRSLSRASGITPVYRWFTFLRSLIPSSASRNLRLLAAGVCTRNCVGTSERRSLCLPQRRTYRAAAVPCWCRIRGWMRPGLSGRLRAVLLPSPPPVACRPM
jgi:hypothetical protein